MSFEMRRKEARYRDIYKYVAIVASKFFFS